MKRGTSSDGMLLGLLGCRVGRGGSGMGRGALLLEVRVWCHRYYDGKKCKFRLMESCQFVDIYGTWALRRRYQSGCVQTEWSLVHEMS